MKTSRPGSPSTNSGRLLSLLFGPFAAYAPRASQAGPVQSLWRTLCLLCSIFAVAGSPLQAQSDSRQEIELSNDAGWQFFGVGGGSPLPVYGSSGYSNASWSGVSVPHVFQSRLRPSNVLKGWYRRDYTVPANLAGKRLYLIFEGAAAIGDVYVNGQHLGQHRGAYTRFIFDATSALKVGSNNTVAISVDDDPASMNDLLPDGDRLYKVWGGLYRKVWLMATDELHVDPTDYSSPGVYITPTNVSVSSADLSIEVLVRNSSTSTQSAQVRATLLGPNDAAVVTLTGTAAVSSGTRAKVVLTGNVSNPKLWSPASPNLYHVVVDILRAGQVVDSLVEPTGFRTLQWGSPSKGYVKLNGSQIILFGADLHQETESKATAVSDADLSANFGLMKDLGLNWVRLSHYPRARLEYDLCDEQGFLCWAENGHTNTDSPTATADNITTEMVRQNYNHPSIAVWSVGNEAGTTVADREVPVVRALDSTRAVVVANMTAHGVDFRADNPYPGWYGSNDRWSFQTSGYISETGGGGVVTTHTDYAKATWNYNTYEPEEYQQLLAEARFQKAVHDNTGALGMFTWWILRDFTDMKYKKPVGLNTKGLTTYAADKKDVYYLYRCFLRPTTPTVHITSKRYFLRQGSATNGIKAYSSADKLTLTLNGQVVSTLNDGQYKNEGHTVNHVFYWPVQLRTGKNTVSVSDGGGNTDSTVVYFQGSGGGSSLPANPLVTNLTSSNSSNAAYYMDTPVHEQWPVYYDLDSTADNSFDRLPTILQGATWIATQRLTKAGQQASLSFKVDRPATVYVMATKTSSAPSFLSGFSEVSSSNLLWRDNNLNLVSAQLFSRSVAVGTTINVGQPDRDAVVLFQESAAAGGVATPNFSPAGGIYATAQSVILLSSTSGATLRYTTDGSTPTTTSGILYGGAISVSSNTTINALAFKTGFTDSNVASATYTISGSGSTVYQAENGTWDAASGVETTNAGWTGTGYVNTNNALGSFVEVTASVSVTGSYKLDFRFANGAATARSADLGINGTMVSAGLSFGSTGAWSTWSDLVVTKTLTAGANKVRLTATSANGLANLDAVTVSP